MTITDALQIWREIQAAADAADWGHGDCECCKSEREQAGAAVIEQAFAAHRLAGVIEGRRQMQSEIERALRIYPEWCANWGMDYNMKAATAAANECADMLKVLPTDLPEDDEDAGCAIAAAIRAIPLEPPA